MLLAHHVGRTRDRKLGDPPTAMHMTVVLAVHGNKSSDNRYFAQIAADSRPEVVVRWRTWGVQTARHVRKPVQN